MFTLAETTLSQPLTLLMTVIVTHTDQEVPRDGQVHKSPADYYLSHTENKSNTHFSWKNESEAVKISIKKLCSFHHNFHMLTHIFYLSW